MVFYRYCVFYKLKVVETLCRTSLWAPFFHSIFSLRVSHILVKSHNSSSLLLLYLLRWSVISGLWCYYYNCFGHHEPCPCKKAYWIDRCCLWFDCSAHHSFPYISDLPVPWKPTVLKLCQLIILQWPLNVQVKGRVTCLTLNQKLEMIKLSEESMLKAERL